MKAPLLGYCYAPALIVSFLSGGMKTTVMPALLTQLKQQNTHQKTGTFFLNGAGKADTKFNSLSFSLVSQGFRA